MHYNMEKKQDM